MSEERKLLERAINYLRGEGKLIADIDACLAKPETIPVPVAYYCEKDPDVATAFNWIQGTCKNKHCVGKLTPLYTLPTRKELSDNEILEIWRTEDSLCRGSFDEMRVNFARAVLKDAGSEA